FGSFADQTPAHQPVERAGSRAVPRPSGASRPRAVEGSDHRLHPQQVLTAEAALLGRSAAGPGAVRGPHTFLRPGYRPSPQREVWPGPPIIDPGSSEQPTGTTDACVV